jgi:hypothetical protein
MPKGFSIHLSVLLLWMISAQGIAQEPGNCINSDEAELLQLVDEYRADNNLANIPWSQSLMTVAKWHTIDAALNDEDIFAGNCNRHSWSDTRPDLWTGMCYTPDHAQAARMWSKPSEITNGLYTAPGYENAAWGYGTVASAMGGWKNSPGHNAVMLNEGIWASQTWRAMGVGVDLVNRYYFLWFSASVDPLGDMPACSDGEPEDSIFSSDFE